MEYCSVYATEKDIEASRAIIKECMEKANIRLTEKELDLLTKDIMDTAAMMGGNYEEDSIRGVCEEYIESNFYPRFLKLHRRELGGPLFRY